MNAGKSPSHIRVIRVATTAASTVGTKADRAKCPRITSWANNTPAIGALKLADTAAAAPDASRTRRAAGDKLNFRSRKAAIAAPRCTAGPSRPTLAPDPIEIADATAETSPARSEMSARCSAPASITSEMPCARRSLMNFQIIRPTTSPPSVGPATTTHGARKLARVPTTFSLELPSHSHCT